ncbi:sensor histidine kinase [Streptomyces sp. HC44]|uniref:histidine kinase n=1 Tax=Streptomyces scabichelini TaxID=2711217 RepID=A0A6G4VGN4_9ACTN|nr:sensor histidine kinase [Streptomyces scabichelini]NGO12947.1 sensor histidine kinase [Streptomyces scabichelini]
MSNAATPPGQEPRAPADESAGHGARHRALAAVRRRLGTARDGLRAAGPSLREASATFVPPTGAAEPLLAQAPKRWMRRLPYVIVLGFAAVLVPVTAQVLGSDYGVNDGLSGALGFAQAAPLLLAVSRPLLAWWIIFPANLIGAIAVLNDGAGRPSPFTAMAIVGYVVLCLALSLRETRRTVIGVWLATAVMSLVLAAPEASSDSQDTSVLMIVLSGAALLLGTLLRERGETRRRLVEQETISEAERARRTLLEERARIARELHDVVAHHMTVISVQADSAPYRLADVSDDVRGEFESIAVGARDSLSEMRRLLQVLRSEDTQDERAPQPGLDKLRQLVEATRRGGVPVELSLPEPTLVKEWAKVSPAVDLSAYRIVQEALSNVVRHAPGAPTQVSLSTDGRHLTVLVVNGPGAKPVSGLESSGTGHGLVGMGERVRLVGGSLDVGPLPDGGFRVAARLPVAEPPSPAEEPMPEPISEPISAEQSAQQSAKEPGPP